MCVDVRPPSCGQANVQVSTCQLDMQLLYLLQDDMIGLSLKIGIMAQCTVAVVSLFYFVTVSPVIKVSIMQIPPWPIQHGNSCVSFVHSKHFQSAPQQTAVADTHS